MQNIATYNIYYLWFFVVYTNWVTVYGTRVQSAWEVVLQIKLFTVYII